MKNITLSIPREATSLHAAAKMFTSIAEQLAENEHSAESLAIKKWPTPPKDVSESLDLSPIEKEEISPVEEPEKEIVIKEENINFEKRDGRNIPHCWLVHAENGSTCNDGRFKKKKLITYEELERVEKILKKLAEERDSKETKEQDTETKEDELEPKEPKKISTFTELFQALIVKKMDDSTILKAVQKYDLTGLDVLKERTELIPVIAQELGL